MPGVPSGGNYQNGVVLDVTQFPTMQGFAFAVWTFAMGLPGLR